MNEKLSFKFTALTLGLLLLLIPVFSVFHELGHATACEALGHNSEIGFGGKGGAISFSAYTNCDPDFNDSNKLLQFRLAGGFLSATIALLLFAGFKNKLIGKLKPIAIVLVSIGAVEYVNMIMEGFSFDFYIHWGSSINGFLFLVIPVILIIKLSPRIPRKFNNIYSDPPWKYRDENA